MTFLKGLTTDLTYKFIELSHDEPKRGLLYKMNLYLLMRLFLLRFSINICIKTINL